MIEIIVDNFAGGGGASSGIEAAIGRPIDYAINHNREAIAMYQANHPHTETLTEDVWKVNPLALTQGRRVALGWFSPDCTFHSKARGGKPFRDRNVARRLRGLAWVVVKWARLSEAIRPQIIMLENVEEFADWGPLREDGTPCPLRKGFTFRRWWKQLENLGYKVEMRELRACDYGAPTSRKRLFIIARCDGQPIVWPERTHGFEFRPYRTAAECVDWSIPMPSIFLTKEEAKAWGKYYGVRPPKRPWAEATLRRVARGIFRYVINNPQPYIVRTAHGDVGRNGSRRWGKGEHSLYEPLPTITSSSADFAIIAPSLVQIGYGEREGQAPRCLDIQKPLSTVVGQGNKHALVAAFLARHYGGHENDGASLRGPIPTITSKDHHALITAHIQRDFGQSVGQRVNEPIGAITGNANGHAALIASSIVKLKGSCRDGQPINQPLHTIQAQGTHYAQVHAFLTKYYGTEQDARLELPLHTITTKDRFALVTVESEQYVITDICGRMFSSRELYRCQGFSDDYIINPLVPHETNDGGVIYKPLTKTAQIRMCGNSVPPDVAEALVRANYVERRAEAAA